MGKGNNPTVLQTWPKMCLLFRRLVRNLFSGVWGTGVPRKKRGAWGAAAPPNGALRGGTTSLFEGGLRSPSIIHWPALVPKGQVISEPVVTIDVYPTLLAAAGGDPAAYDIDGLDIFPVVSRGASTPHDQLFWEFRQQTAVRRGPWKLTLRPYQSDDNLSEHDVFLADLSTDIGETVNLRHVHRELTEELTAAALAWRSDVAPYYE